MNALRSYGLVLGLLAACDCGCGSSPRTSQGTTALEPTPNPDSVTSPDASARAVYVGTNIAAPSYGTRNYPFVDLMRQADRTWISGNADEWDDGRTIAVDAQGWIRSLEPGQIARTFLIAGDDPDHLSGELTVLYEGEGEIEYLGRVSNLRRAEGRDTFELSPPDGLFININRVDPSDPIRNIRVIAPGGSCAQDDTKPCRSSDECAPERCVPYTETPERTFHAEFLEELRPFSVLRFMDWQLTNRLLDVDDSEEPRRVEQLSDLPRASYAFWQPVPVEVMVQLANEMNADPWFNIPHTATDEFVRDFARVVAANLAPERKVYVEYSNEVWNGIFDQHYFMNRRGCETYSDDPRSECSVDGQICGPGEWGPAQERCRAYGIRFFAERTAEIGEIFRREFAQHAESSGRPSERVIRVLGAQIGAGETFVPQQLLHQVRGRPIHELVDAVAVAPYFGGDVEAATLDELFRRTRRDDVPDGMYELLSGTPDAQYGGIYHWIRTDLAALDELPEGSVRYIAYEGGQHLHTFDENRMPMFLAANRDPRMEQVYAQYLRMWHELTGGALFVHYTTSSIWGRYGGFGAMERQGADLAESPKRRALEAFAHGAARR